MRAGMKFVKELVFLYACTTSLCYCVKPSKLTEQILRNRCRGMLDSDQRCGFHPNVVVQILTHISYQSVSERHPPHHADY